MKLRQARKVVARVMAEADGYRENTLTLAVATLYRKPVNRGCVRRPWQERLRGVR